MPTALPPIPATKATDTARKTPPKRPEREESFKRVLNGARRQIKPKPQHEKKDTPAPAAPSSNTPSADTAPSKTTPGATDVEPPHILDEPSVPTIACEKLSEPNDDDAVPPLELPVIATHAPVPPPEASLEEVSEEVTCENGISDVDAVALATSAPALADPDCHPPDVSAEPVPTEPAILQEAVALNPIPLVEDATSDSESIDLSSIENEQTGATSTQSTETTWIEPAAATTTTRQQMSAALDDAPASPSGRAPIPTNMAQSEGDNPTDGTAEPHSVDDGGEPETFATVAERSAGVARGLTLEAIEFNAEPGATAAADDAMVNPMPANPGQTGTAKVTVPAAPVADPLEARFAEMNHPRILTAVQSELVPHGGTVRLRLDPPELGALQVRIDVRDGVLAASFQTSNDEATRLLTQSLQQLKTTLESQGVTVEKLHVHQTPREQFDGQRGGDDRREQQSPQQWQQQEQQRREMLQRMWRRVRDGRDPFDLVA